MTSKLRVALFIPDGVAVRNFVLGRFLNELVSKGPVDLYHNLPEQVASKYASATPEGVEWQPILDYPRPGFRLSANP